MTNMTIEFQPNKKDLPEAALIFMYQRPFLKMTVKIMQIMAFLTLLLCFWLLQKSQLHIEHVSFLGVATLMALLHKNINRFILRARFSKANDALSKMEVTFSDTHIKIRYNKGANHTIDWKWVKCVKTAQIGWVICFTKQQFLFIPHAALAVGETKSVLENLFKEKKLPIL